MYSSNVWVIPLLDMLARPCMPPVGCAARAARCMHLLFPELHESFTNLRRPYILVKPLLLNMLARLVWVAPLLDMLARPCIPPMSG